MINDEHNLKPAANASAKSGALRQTSSICVMLHSPFRLYVSTNLRSVHCFRGFACMLHKGITLAHQRRPGKAQAW
jgi:hypothetical protein